MEGAGVSTAPTGDRALPAPSTDTALGRGCSRALRSQDCSQGYPCAQLCPLIHPPAVVGHWHHCTAHRALGGPRGQLLHQFHPTISSIIKKKKTTNHFFCSTFKIKHLDFFQSITFLLPHLLFLPGKFNSDLQNLSYFITSPKPGRFRVTHQALDTTSESFKFL